ncbi:MAG TPA: hypothetical protein VEH04_19195 [Verrucomicrobiae bacterium]|nr:hypothetical protein [Verrucomicrobiae bacterium]
MKKTQHYRIWTSLMCLATASVSAQGRANSPAASRPQATAPTAAATGETIQTTDGKTYRQATITRQDADGVLVQFKPDAGGLGWAKVKFRNLPDPIRSRYQYDENAATEAEARHSQALSEWRNRVTAQEGAFQRYRALAELNRSLAGDDVAVYSVAIDANGNVVANGFTGARDALTGWWNHPLAYGMSQLQGSAQGSGAPAAASGNSGTTPTPSTRQ